LDQPFFLIWTTARFADQSCSRFSSRLGGFIPVFLGVLAPWRFNSCFVFPLCPLRRAQDTLRGSALLLSAFIGGSMNGDEVTQ
jgi:hypothetical protein